jgi:hypothetical protein
LQCLRLEVTQHAIKSERIVSIQNVKLLRLGDDKVPLTILNKS